MIMGEERDAAEFIVTHRVPVSLTVMPQYMWDAPLTDDDLIYLLTEHFLSSTVVLKRAQSAIDEHKHTTAFKKKVRLGYD
jgi:hypothetical protein